jgi:hypothetical protein
MDLIILLPTVLLILCGIQAGFAKIARSKGGSVPWTISPSTKPPRCANELLNRAESVLLVIVTPLAILLMLVGLVLALLEEFTPSAWLLIAGFILISLRPLFVAGCFAFAELESDAPEVSPA